MSSSEPVFSAHSSFKQQNGDISSSSSRPVRASMESIKSVHENPFYKNFGIKHSAPSYHRQVNRTVVSEELKRVSSNGRSSSVEDDIGEYRPGSGYVHKLLDKFSSLTAREEHVIPVPHLKRSSSLDELPLENETVKDSVVMSRAVGLGYEKPSFLSAAKLSHRARSIEGLNHSHQKFHRGTAISNQYVDSKWGVDKQSFTHKSPRDSQVVAADVVDHTRDDLIVNENSAALENVDENERYDETDTVVSSHETVFQNELPKPNTVLTVRNIFESASSGSVVPARRQRSDSPSFVSMQSTKPVLPPFQGSHISASSQGSGLNRSSSRSSSPLASPKHASDAHVKLILPPTSSSLSKAENIRPTSDSDLPSRSNVQKSVATISGNSGMSISRPQTTSSPYRTNASPTSPSAFSPNSTEGRLFRFDRENSLEANGTSSSLNNTNSHSISNVEATVPGVQLHSFAISNNQKSSHAVSSSSFKDKIEDGKHYEQPVMIFAKSNLSPKKIKPLRIRDYTPLSDGVDDVNEEAEQFKDASRTKETNKQFDANDYTQSASETSNKVLSQKRIFESNSNISDKNTSNQSKSVPIRNQIIKEVKNSLKGVLDNEKSNSEKSKNSAATETLSKAALKKSNVRKPIVEELPIYSESQFAETINNFKDSKKRVTFAVIPTAQEDDEKPSSHSSEGITTSHELISDTYKDTVETERSHPDESPALNDQPFSPVSKIDAESKEQPIKGIPSIVAQRLKKQHFDPSQVAEDVVSTSDASDHLKETSKKYLDSASANTTSSGNNENDSLSTEIANEISNVRRKMEESRSKSSGLVPIFDSSQLSKKRKEKTKQQTSVPNEVVPALDLSGLTDDQSSEYQPEQKKVAPCNIIFVGENANTSRSLLTKQRKIKINIHFNDAKTETFEYPSEATALEHYLEDHPHEKDEILVLEDFTGGGDESSDEVQIDVFETPVTPRGSADDDLLKSNTSLAHAGSLQSYRGRFQQDYELGTVQLEEPKKLVEPDPVVDPDKLMLRPAEEEDTNTWSTSSSSDILF